MPKQMAAHPWIFGGLLGIPFCLHTVVILLLFALPQSRSLSEIPHWAWLAAFVPMPLLSGAVGLGVAYGLVWVLDWLKRSFSGSLGNLYAASFIAAWNVVFGYLNFFSFAMGTGAPPEPSSVKELSERVFMVLCQSPICILISIVVCSVFAGIVGTTGTLIFRAIVRQART